MTRRRRQPSPGNGISHRHVIKILQRFSRVDHEQSITDKKSRVHHPATLLTRTRPSSFIRQSSHFSRVWRKYLIPLSLRVCKHKSERCTNYKAASRSRYEQQSCNGSEQGIPGPLSQYTRVFIQIARTRSICMPLITGHLKTIDYDAARTP